MSDTSALHTNEFSTLHLILKDCYTPGVNGPIDLFVRLSEMKKKAEADWLKGLDKNGYEHAERLEEYLCALTQHLCKNNRLSTAEIFVLLCAVYMHDVGYLKDGRLLAKDHPERSRDYILNDLEKYLLHDFPPFKGKLPRVAEAIGLVTLGHSEERFVTLKGIPNDFPDKALSNDPLNLRKLAALLRIADEADDPYIRPMGASVSSIRDENPLVRIGTETIAWHWGGAGVQKPDEFVAHLKNKTKILQSSIDYLREVGGGNWYLVLHPQVAGTVPYMAEKPVETFVGRESDLAALHAVVKRRRTGAITGVTGTGGIGKTELARMYAQFYKDEYIGGIFWASMKGSNWKAEAQKIFAVIRPGADPAAFLDEARARDEVTRALERKEALLIIDNVNENEEIIGPECSVLVTTRNKDAFGILPKQSIYPLGRFEIDEGVKLLKEILGENRVKQDRDGAARVVEILGGMPLAVEIAAKHLSDTPDTTFPEYIGWVQGKVDRLKIEDTPDKDVIASLMLSVEMLEKEKNGDKLLALFEAASVCAESGFTSKALVSAAGFGDMDRTAQQLVGKLHSRSLLEYPEESRRYSMHPLVRQMSERMLGTLEGREKEYKKNHCAYFLHYAEAHSKNPRDLIQERDGLWHAIIQTIQVGWKDEKLPVFLGCISRPFWDYIAAHEYKAAFRYLVALNLINVDNLGCSRELVEILTPLYTNKTRLEDGSLSYVLKSLGGAYTNLGEYRKAIELFEQAFEIDRRIGNVQGAGVSLGNIGSAYIQLCEYRKAIELFEQVLEIDRRIGHMQGEGVALTNMGQTYANLSEYRKAIELFEQALEIERRIGDVRGEGVVLDNMGIAYASLGEYRKAIEFYEQALEIERRIGHMQGEGASLGNMGSAYMELGESHKAIELFDQALEIERRIGDVRNEGASLGNMGFAYANLGEYHKAIEFYEQALEIARRIGHVQGEGASLSSMGFAYLELGESHKAIELFEQALEIERRIGDVRNEGNTLNNMGLAYANLGEYHKAIEFYEQALEIARRIGDVQGEGNSLGNMGSAYMQLGEYSKAIEFYGQALEIDRRIGNVHGEGSTLGNMGSAS